MDEKLLARIERALQNIREVIPNASSRDQDKMVSWRLLLFQLKAGSFSIDDTLFLNYETRIYAISQELRGLYTMNKSAQTRIQEGQAVLEDKMRKREHSPTCENIKQCEAEILYNLLKIDDLLVEEERLALAYRRIEKVRSLLDAYGGPQ